MSRPALPHPAAPPMVFDMPGPTPLPHAFDAAFSRTLGGSADPLSTLTDALIPLLTVVPDLPSSCAGRLKA